MDGFLYFFIGDFPNRGFVHEFALCVERLPSFVGGARKMGAGVVEVANDVRKIGELAFRHGINRRALRCCFAVLQDVGIVLQGNGGGHGILGVEFRV